MKETVTKEKTGAENTIMENIMEEKHLPVEQGQNSLTADDESKEKKKKRKRRKKRMKQIRKWISIVLEILKIVVAFGAVAFVFRISNTTTGDIVANSPGAVGGGNVEYYPYIDQSKTENIENFIKNEVADELTQANLYMLSGDYENARILYEKGDYADNPAVMINLGYIYGNTMGDAEENLKTAIAYYQKAECVEADRNLLGLYLKNLMVDDAALLLDKLIEQRDVVVLDYIAYCLYDQSWEEYTKGQETAVNTGEIIENLCEWETSNNYYSGYNPPADTVTSRWNYQGIDFSYGGNVNHPYAVYREQSRRLTKGIARLEKCYYMQNGELMELR